MIDRNSYKFKDKTNEKYITNEGYTITIIEYTDCKNCTVKFENGLILKNKEYGNIKKGKVKNPYHPSIYERGYFGVGKYSAKTHSLIYQKWYDMFIRCYSEKYQAKKPTYKDCSVSEDWYDFQNFAEWFEDNYIEGWELDKDVIIKRNKIYSPITCCFIPPEINIAFVKSDKSRGDLPIGVYKSKDKLRASICKNGKTKHLGCFHTPIVAFLAYKEAKEEYIKELADKYSFELKEEVYEALYNYKVEIND